MSQSIGQKLAAARKRRDQTIEDVSHETRIHVDTLRHLEADDYSRFANYTYAKSFLSMYGRHLGLDMTDYLKEFRSSDNGGPDTGDLLDAPANGSATAEVFAPVSEFQRYRPIAALVVLLAVICMIPGMYFLGRSHGTRSANRIAQKEAFRAAAQIQDDGLRTPPVIPGTPPAAPPAASETTAAAVADAPPAARPEVPAPAATPETPAPARPAVTVETPASPAVPARRPDEPVEVRRPAILLEEAPSEVKKAVPVAPEAPAAPPTANN